jgi:hypothetical protein
MVIVEGTAEEGDLMIRESLLLALASLASVCLAHDRPRQAPPASATDTSEGQGFPGADAPKFVSEAKWMLAGYNNNEVVYAVFVTNQDTRILRCTTEVKGFYFENNAKLSIADRQVTTVFPNQPTQVGYWMDMDESSGATYTVKCHPV